MHTPPTMIPVAEPARPIRSYAGFFVPILLGALAATGCSGNDAGGTTGTTGGAVTTASATATATASAKSTASAKAATPKPRRAPKSYDALRAELEKKCPTEAKDTNLEQKEAVAKAVECLRRKMIKDLDDVLVPLKKSDETKFKALMKEQADWNRNVDVACWLEEERSWLDLASGGRDDGTMRSYAFMGCLDDAYTDRILYARSLAAGKIEPLVKRIEEKQADGRGVREALTALKAAAAKFTADKPKVEPPLMEADWKRVGESAENVGGASAMMAASTCSAWPDLAKALGGKEGCTTKVELYYLAQGLSPNTASEK